MASPEALEKLRAVLDYIPEEAARRLPGDPQDYYDALTRRLSRTIAAKTVVKRKVIVEQPDLSELEEPAAPAWAPPPPRDVPEQPAWEPESAPLPAAASSASSVVEAAPPMEASDVVLEAQEEAEATEDFFDVVRRAPGAREMEPVEPDVALSESEWRHLEAQPDIPEEVAEAPVVAGEPEPPAPAEEDDAFEELELPAAGRGEFEPVPGEVGVAEPVAEALEFEVEEEGEVTLQGEFEVLEETEGFAEEGLEPPYQVNEFTLFKREVRARNGRVRSTYFFSAEPVVEDAQPAPLPEGYEVLVNPQTGIPVVRKSAARVLPIIEIEGIGPIMAERLDRAGVRTTRDLLRADLRVVAGETGISDRLLGNFRAMADLLQLPGIYPDQAAGLVYAGCRSLADLNAASPGELSRSVNKAAKDHQLKLRGKMTPARIKAWQNKIYNLEQA